MTSLTKNTQFNFRTNSDLLKQAKEVFAENNLDISSSLNLFLEKVVEENKIPFETTFDEENERIFQNLQSQIQEGYASYRTGKKISSAEMRAHFGL